MLCMLPELSGVQVPRCYRVNEKRAAATSIHTMVDVSLLAYAAVSYVRHEYEDGEVTVQFAVAKAKVAPTKAETVPRLELMAAVLGLRLTRKVSELLDIPFENCTLWTDSKDVICWIQGQSRRYKTFVANRVSEIHEKSNPRQWRHIPTELNCADDATRGLHARVLTIEHRWFRGPEFLYENEDGRPQGKYIVHEERSDECIAEMVKGDLCVRGFTATDKSTKVLQLDRPIRVTAWVKRFADNLLNKVKKQGKLSDFETGEGVILTPGELDRAGKLWVKQAQEKRFPEEIHQLITGKEVRKQSHLKPLTPMADELGI